MAGLDDLRGLFQPMILRFKVLSSHYLKRLLAVHEDFSGFPFQSKELIS